MKTIEYEIELLSDAEPGTGLGGAGVDGYLPRGVDGKPFLPASHIKGLVREELLRLQGAVSCDGLVERALGRPDSDGESKVENESIARFSDAVVADGCQERAFTARTAIDAQTGTAKDASLRAVEILPAGARFAGRVVCAGDGTSREELAIETALLAIGAIGGSRNRGAGRVLVRVKGEKRRPGALLLEALKAKEFERNANLSEGPKGTSTELKALRIVFKADSPVCCPDAPVVGNAIESGTTIPASAVRGWLISRAARLYGRDAVSELYNSPDFRAWPMLPCSYELDVETNAAPVPVRVSLSHKVAKLAVDGDELTEQEAEDKPLRVADVRESANPLKAQDGVLLLDADEKVALWKARTLPRVIMEHCSLNGQKDAPASTEDPRKFFTTASIAPLAWSCFVSGPKRWLDAVEEDLKSDPEATFGAFRSVLGGGRAFAVKEKDDSKRTPWALGTHANVLILQSPVEMPNEYLARVEKESANRLLEEFIRKEWPRLFEGTNLTVEAVSTTFRVQFGWNRGFGGLQSARLVANPGSIFVFKPQGTEGGDYDRQAACETLRQAGLAELIRKGLGPGVERGFGSVAVHPGVASRLYGNPGEKRPTTKKSAGNKAELFRRWIEIGRKNRGRLPSVSQIAAVAGIAARDRMEAAAYLDEQTVRLKRVYDVWRDVKNDVETLLTDSKYSNEDVQFALKTLGDWIKSES